MKRNTLAAVALSTLTVAAAYVLAFFPSAPPRLAPVLLAVGTAGILASVLALAVHRDEGLGILWLPILTVVVVVGVGLVALVLMPAASPGDESLVLGLPPRAALLLYGVGLLPTTVVPVVYALTFERLTLTPEDLERVRRAGRNRASSSDDGDVS